MSLVKGSRYEGLDVTAIIDENDVARAFLHARIPLSSEELLLRDPDFTRHTVQEGDQLDTLAWNISGDETLWWIIAEVNNLFDPFTLTIGSELLIPSAEFFRSF